MALLCVCNIAKGQDINAHKNRVNEIEKEIDYLNRQISNTQKKHKNTLEELPNLRPQNNNGTKHRCGVERKAKS